MKCSELAANIERMQPEANPRDVARLCLLLSNRSGDLSDFVKDDNLAAAWRNVAMRLHAATDQHAAMTEDLDALAKTDPRQFTADQIWTLIRSIKVQSQVLHLYLGDACPAETT
jgi:hypothetical protein